MTPALLGVVVFASAVRGASSSLSASCEIHTEKCSCLTAELNQTVSLGSASGELVATLGYSSGTPCDWDIEADRCVDKDFGENRDGTYRLDTRIFDKFGTEDLEGFCGAIKEECVCTGFVPRFPDEATAYQHPENCSEPATKAICSWDGKGRCFGAQATFNWAQHLCPEVVKPKPIRPSPPPPAPGGGEGGTNRQGGGGGSERDGGNANGGGGGGGGGDLPSPPSPPSKPNETDGSKAVGTIVAVVVVIVLLLLLVVGVLGGRHYNRGGYDVEDDLESLKRARHESDVTDCAIDLTMLDEMVGCCARRSLCGPALIRTRRSPAVSFERSYRVCIPRTTPQLREILLNYGRSYRPPVHIGSAHQALGMYRAACCCDDGWSSMVPEPILTAVRVFWCFMGVLHSGSSDGVASPGAYDSDNGYLSSTPSPGTHHVVPEQSKRPLPLLSDTVDLVPALPDASNQATGQANFTPELSADLLDSIAEADSEAVPDIGLLVPDLATVLDGTETGSSDMQVEQIDLPLIDDLATLSLPTTVRMCLNCSEHSPPPTKT